MEISSPLKYRGKQKTMITQPFGVNKKNYTPMDGHNGIDFVNGHLQDCYGIGIVAAQAGEVVRIVETYPMSTKGNGVYVDTIECNKRYRLVYWHLSEVLVKVGDWVSQGQLLGRMGNSGTVRPVPTAKRPYNGTHLHFGVYLYNRIKGSWIREDNNYRGAIDPMQFFTAHTLAVGFKEQQDKDVKERNNILIAPIVWAIEKLLALLRK